MRLRRRHAWSAALIVLFALPVIRPEGFPSIESRVDSFLGYPARASAGNPHEWSAHESSSSADGGTRVRDLEQIVVSEREKHYQLLDEFAQRLRLTEALQDFQRKPLATPARILRAHDASRARRSLLIDRGSDEGVEVGEAVVSGNVFVGVVAHVDSHTARVQMLTDPYARLEVAVRTSDGVRQTAFLHGGQDDDLPLHNLRGAEGLHVRLGDAVVTSNASEVVPAGLMVGTVSKASDDDADAILDVTIHPSADLARSTTVLVLKPGE
jgi:rod shape-determining protein MreC